MHCLFIDSDRIFASTIGSSLRNIGFVERFGGGRLGMMIGGVTDIGMHSEQYWLPRSSVIHDEPAWPHSIRHPFDLFMCRQGDSNPQGV